MPARSTFLDQLHRFYREGRRFGGWLAGTTASPAPRLRRHPESRVILQRAFREGVTAFVQARRFTEADSLAEQALAVMPDDPDVLVQYALSAQNDQRPMAAVERWRRALPIAPDVVACHVGLAAGLRETGDYKGAQAAIDEAQRQFPKDDAVAAEAARLAELRDVWRQAIDTLRASPAEQPESEPAREAVFADLPDDADLNVLEDLLASAWAASSSAAYPTPIATPRDASPHVDPASARDPLTSDAKDRSVGGAPATSAEPAEVAADEPVLTEEEEAVKQLLLRFESLGETYEFGLVQRRYTAEPMGLLRWNSVTFDQLIQALEHRFFGMGETPNTHIAVAADGEYCIHDRRWDLSLHTFQYDGRTNRDALYKRMCGRISYLRNKLISDLSEAEKIFVYVASELDSDRIRMLHRTLRAFGPVKLLMVLPATDSSEFESTPGHVVKIGDGLHVGYLRRTGRDAEGNWDIAYEDWISICRKVAEAV